MKRFWMGTLLAIALVPAYAADTQGSKADKPRVVCTKERTTGSNLRKRSCMTQAQHEDRRKRDQEAMERMRSTPRPNDVSG